MIFGLPLQLDSPGKHTRGYGCYAHALAAMAQDQCGEVLTPLQLRDIILAAILEGEILDNDIETTEKGWRRCFVLDPAAFIRRIALYLGRSLMDCKLAGKFSDWPSEPTLANYAIIEHETHGKDSKGNDYTGSHFTLGEIDVTTWEFIDAYNSWPGLSTLTGRIISYRKWEVRR
jgi:hypothetical protein